MPTIEIISLNATGLGLRQQDFDAAIIEEPVLCSHRALFQDFLNERRGVIVHLGNPDFKEDTQWFFAGALLDWMPEADTCDAASSRFRFLSAYEEETARILRAALMASPARTAYFLTDIQDGDRAIGDFSPGMPLHEFWRIHATSGLAFNTLYMITE